MALLLLFMLDRSRQHPPKCDFVAVREEAGSYAVDHAGLLISNSMYTDVDKLQEFRRISFASNLLSGLISLETILKNIFRLFLNPGRKWGKKKTNSKKPYSLCFYSSFYFLIFYWQQVY